jgi:ABC-2 type transport system permease protein
MSAFAVHLAYEFRTGVRNWTLLLMTYLLPLGFFLMTALIMPGLNPFFLPVMVPAMVIFAILAATLLGLPDPLVQAREAGIFRSYKINGIPAGSILLIPALTTALHLAIVTVIITAVGGSVFGAPLPESWIGFVSTFAVATLGCAGLSVLIGVASSSTRVQLLWSQTIFLPSMLLGGLMIPWGQLPPVASKVALLLPATHAMNAFKGLAMEGPADFDPWASIATLAASGVLGFALAIYLFSWDRHSAKRRGHPALALLVLVPYLVAMVLL